MPPARASTPGELMPAEAQEQGEPSAAAAAADRGKLLTETAVFRRRDNRKLKVVCEARVWCAFVGEKGGCGAVITTVQQKPHSSPGQTQESSVGLRGDGVWRIRSPALLRL